MSAAKEICFVGTRQQLPTDRSSYPNGRIAFNYISDFGIRADRQYKPEWVPDSKIRAYCFLSDFVTQRFLCLLRQCVRTALDSAGAPPPNSAFYHCKFWEDKLSTITLNVTQKIFVKEEARLDDDSFFKNELKTSKFVGNLGRYVAQYWRSKEAAILHESRQPPAASAQPADVPVAVQPHPPPPPPPAIPTAAQAHDPDEIADRHGLDAGARSALQRLTPEQLATVMDDGFRAFLDRSRNPSATIMSKVKRVRSEPHPPAAPPPLALTQSEGAPLLTPPPVPAAGRWPSPKRRRVDQLPPKVPPVSLHRPAAPPLISRLPVPARGWAAARVPPPPQ
eukprot:TRINITY_DN1140_c3_g1_i1.p1 TRINITY_DN1140_c3_g1~~TRINITY_DN1140_c3_g1_i1.p1  ORF type:complete len:336 (+),score=59.72 TRINITY_DN1140_c3_g1_i1:117-1124(+)